MYAAPTAMIGSAVGFGDVLVAHTLHGLCMGWYPSTLWTNTIVRVYIVEATFALEKAASKIDTDIDTVCFCWVCIPDKCCMKTGGSAKANMRDGLGGQLKAAATKL